MIQRQVSDRERELNAAIEAERAKPNPDIARVMQLVQQQVAEVKASYQRGAGDVEREMAARFSRAS